MSSIALERGLTHSATLRKLLYEALASLGFDPTRIYRQALHGLPLSALQLSAREQHEHAPRFWQALPGLTGDAQIGLHLAAVMQWRPMDALGYLLLASRDLGQALQCLVRFQAIMSGGFSARLEQSGEQARLIFDLNYRGVGSLPQQVECLALLKLKMLAQLSGSTLQPLAVEFRHAQPANVMEHQRLLGVLPRFSQAHDALVLPRACLNRASRTANAQVFAVLYEQAELELAQLQENQLLNRLRYWLQLHLTQPGCDLAHCAQAMGLSQSSLQRALAAQQQSFRQLHDEVRKAQAQHLLEQGVAIREVARACGFAELSPFYRAFKRWQGMPPQRYREVLEGA